METKKLSSSTIKIIAIISMLIDHTGAFLVDAMKYPELYEIMRTVGRIAFPIFCFTLVEGFLHTSDVKKYMMRLFAFALVSEIPFDLAVSGSYGMDWSHQNVFFTLLIGLITLYFIELNEHRKWLQLVIIFVSCVVALAMKTDYYMFGIIQIIIFYYCRYIKLHRIAFIIALNMFMGQSIGALALVFTELYNGKRGLNIKYLMYAFYPVHLMILYIIKYLIS